MPYVNIPESKLSSIIAAQVGKIQGDITGQVLKRLGDLESQFRSTGCPKDLKRTRNQLQGLQSNLNSIDNRISKFKRIPNKLKRPVGGLKKALKLVLSIPIPQAVPPGIGIPVNITTKFADVLHLIKEFIKQISDDVDAITHITDGGFGELESVQRAMRKVQFSLKACEIEKELNDKLSLEELEELGFIDEDGDSIFNRLSRNLASNGFERDSRSVAQVARENNASIEDTLLKLGQSNQEAFNDQVNELTNSIKKISDNNLKEELRRALDLFRTPTPIEQSSDIFTHIGPDGRIYKLEIQASQEDNLIAPRRFAVARNVRGVAVLRGPLSFSSSVEVLLDEIKFRIDNQLP